MKRPLCLIAVVVLACTLLASCGGGDQQEVRREPEPVDEQTAKVARTRGVRPDNSEETPPPPLVYLNELIYEWRTHPERGLHVTMSFTNPAGTVERARGYVFLVAEASRQGVTGVYPWNTRLVEGLPEDFTRGTHLLYRDTHQVRAMIPYERSDGMYDRLKLFVYDENGTLLTTRTYELELTSTPGVSKRLNPGFDL